MEKDKDYYNILNIVSNDYDISEPQISHHEYLFNAAIMGTKKFIEKRGKQRFYVSHIELDGELVMVTDTEKGSIVHSWKNSPDDKQEAQNLCDLLNNLSEDQLNIALKYF